MGIALLNGGKSRRPWSAEKEEMYQWKISGPLLELACSISREFARFAPEYVIPPEKVVYPLFGDKGPEAAGHNSRHHSRHYSHPGAIWVHRDARGASGACFYFHFTAREAVVLGGVYAPEPEELAGYRKVIMKNHEELEQILGDRKLRSAVGLIQGDKLRRVPAGFPAGHPAAELIRHKQWYLVSMLDMPLLSTPQLLPKLVELFETMTPFVNFLNRALAKRPRKPAPKAFALAQQAP